MNLINIPYINNIWEVICTLKANIDSAHSVIFSNSESFVILFEKKKLENIKMKTNRDWIVEDPAGVY